ncbi:hypothetical protein IscW_ISCW000331 [Ixodes scapularis]|uniref:Uncharacterized protein n=1 Tax=Ixodes scapularis TaxID=6945 RepID=B7P1J2_IXOSC|nr:hypothetical protein IscW_ISCW000331 [Ixodes scapularis]|eukprot:XP_002433400.1 hypothetical protein IscW_ISCW000331 [Ixodes scapularis]
MATQLISMGPIVAECTDEAPSTPVSVMLVISICTAEAHNADGSSRRAVRAAQVMSMTSCLADEAGGTRREVSVAQVMSMRLEGRCKLLSAAGTSSVTKATFVASPKVDWSVGRGRAVTEAASMEVISISSPKEKYLDATSVPSGLSSKAPPLFLLGSTGGKVIRKCTTLSWRWRITKGSAVSSGQQSFATVVDMAPDLHEAE